MRTFVLHSAEDCRRLWGLITASWRDAIPPLEVKVGQYRDTRSNEQNRLMWVLLDALALQVDWHGERLTSDEWKDVLSASLKKQRAVPGIDGGFVVLGERTSKMTIAEMTEMIDLIEAFGAERGVTFEHEARPA